jgi:hypothetical protein
MLLFRTGNSFRSPVIGGRKEVQVLKGLLMIKITLDLFCFILQNAD